MRRSLRHVLAVDQGTTGTTALILDETGRIRAKAEREFRQIFPRSGWVEHDPEDIWDSVLAATREALRQAGLKPERLSALGLTNQRETTLLWERRTGRSLGNAVVWQDRRTADLCDKLKASGVERDIRARTGLRLDPYFSATKIRWLLDSSRLLRRRAEEGKIAFGTVDSFLLRRLTAGLLHATDPTNASRTLLMNLDRLRWDPGLCAALGIPMAMLPKILPTIGLFGRTQTGTGFPAGIPIWACAGDQQAALFGQACLDRGMAKVTYGTGSFLLVHAGSSCPPPHEGLLTTVAWDLGGHETRPSEPDVAYALEASTFVAGAAIQWLRDGLGLIERSEDLAPLAASVADTGGVVLVPAFTGLGSPWWDPHARGTVIGITRGAGRAQFARAVVESMSFAVRDMVDAVTNALGAAIPALRTDGGASAMELLLQLQADQLQMPVVRPRCIESTALGAAMLAGLAEGVWESVEELAGRWQPDVELVPQVDRATGDLSYATWLRAVERARGWA